MEDTKRHFEKLLTEYRHLIARQDEIIGMMRENLIARNDGNKRLEIYGLNEIVNLETGDIDGLQKANSTLCHYKK